MVSSEDYIPKILSSDCLNSEVIDFGYIESAKRLSSLYSIKATFDSRLLAVAGLGTAAAGSLGVILLKETPKVVETIGATPFSLAALLFFIGAIVAGWGVRAQTISPEGVDPTSFLEAWALEGDDASLPRLKAQLIAIRVDHCTDGMRVNRNKARALFCSLCLQIAAPIPLLLTYFYKHII